MFGKVLGYPQLEEVVVVSPFGAEYTQRIVGSSSNTSALSGVSPDCDDVLRGF